MATETEATTETDFTFRVTFRKEGGWQIEFGEEFSEAPFDDNAKLRVMAQALNALVMRLMQSEIGDELDGDEWEDEDEEENDT